MSSNAIELRIVLNGDKKLSMLKFNTPNDCILKSTRASIKKVSKFNVDKIDDSSESLFHMTESKIKEIKKISELRKQLASDHNTVLTLSDGKHSREYICRPEEAAMENSGYFIMRRASNCMTVTPIDDWYTVQLGAKQSTLTPEEAEKEFANADRRIGSKVKHINSKLDTDDAGVEEKKSNVPNAPQNDTEPTSSKIPAKIDQDAEEENMLFGDHLYAQLSESEEEGGDLNEQGKELKKIMKKTSGDVDQSDSDDDFDSDNESDFDALEKKYSQTKLPSRDLSNIDLPPLALASKGIPDPPKLAPTVPITSTQQEQIPKTPSTQPQLSKGGENEKLIEEKIVKYLSRQSMNTAMLLKKLLNHVPPDFTKEQVVYQMAAVIRKLGIQKKVLSGQTYLDINKK
ncbi:hypothetical protein RF11_06181 [Thelohanellus kitauei]|uniref:General transcription factor IIF subunit 1 n=1 Tax=Thelohanellus kitauei TaxID=669202 RepID=A0A0C2M9J3_THEKT|nr:hypothetical protein RF11_06181 [Thelohanellus kitauei]